jgi:cell division protein FtsB
MFAITYLATIVFIAALGLWIHSLSEQRVADVQTIARLRRNIRELNKEVEDLNNEITMLKVF